MAALHMTTMGSPLHLPHQPLQGWKLLHPTRSGVLQPDGTRELALLQSVLLLQTEMFRFLRGSYVDHAGNAISLKCVIPAFFLGEVCLLQVWSQMKFVGSPFRYVTAFDTSLRFTSIYI